MLILDSLSVCLSYMCVCSVFVLIFQRKRATLLAATFSSIKYSRSNVIGNNQRLINSKQMLDRITIISGYNHGRRMGHISCNHQQQQK